MKNSLRWQWFSQKKIYLLVFAVPFCLMYLVYAVFGVHPYGSGSVLVLDLNGQYVYYYEYLRDAIWGDSSLIYSWSRNLSGEMFGIIGYYLASPFMIIPVLLPRAMMCGSVELMQLCKIGAAAVTFAIYLRHRKNSKIFTVLIFSTIYSLMGYCVVQLMNPMWIDGLIYLPLIVRGIEFLVDDGRKLAVIIPLSLMFIAHFYIGYMVGIFSALYFVFYCFAKKDSPKIEELVVAGLRFALCAVVSVMCAMIILLPVYYSLKLGKFDFTQPKYEFTTKFTVIEFLTKMLPFSYDTVRPEGLPVVYSGVFTIILIPLFFLNKNITMKQKAAYGAFSIIMFFCMYISVIDIAWHGFQTPNWLNYRYSFMFCFLLIVMAAQAFEHLEGFSVREVGGVLFGVAVFLVYLETQSFKHVSILTTLWPVFLIACVYFGVLCFAKKRRSNYAKIAVLLLVCGEIFASSLNTLYSINSDVLYSKYTSYKGYIERGREVMAEIEKRDGSLYRTEKTKTVYRTVNDAMAFGMKGISHSSSTMNAPVIQTLKDLGFTSRGHYVKYQGATPISDSILGIKYVMNKEKPYYNYDYIFNLNGIEVYENPYALSIGYMVDDEIKDFRFYGDDPFLKQNLLLGIMVNQEDERFFKKVYIDNIEYDNCTVTNVGTHKKYVPTVSGNNCHIEFKLTAIEDGMIYCFFPSNYEREVNVWLNHDTFLGTFFEGDNYAIMELGEFKKGEEISVITTVTKDECYMKDQLFYYFDKTAFESAINELKEGQWNITEYTDTYIKGDITASENQIMLTTIPYETGWKIEVDGKETEPIKLVKPIQQITTTEEEKYAFIGIEIPPGTHTVTMKFFPGYFVKGILISIAGVIACVIIWIFERRSKRLLLNSLHDTKPISESGV